MTTLKHLTLWLLMFAACLAIGSCAEQTYTKGTMVRMNRHKWSFKIDSAYTDKGQKFYVATRSDGVVYARLAGVSVRRVKK